MIRLRYAGGYETHSGGNPLPHRLSVQDLLITYSTLSLSTGGAAITPTYHLYLPSAHCCMHTLQQQHIRNLFPNHFAAAFALACTGLHKNIEDGGLRGPEEFPETHPP